LATFTDTSAGRQRRGMIHGGFADVIRPSGRSVVTYISVVEGQLFEQTLRNTRYIRNQRPSAHLNQQLGVRGRLPAFPVATSRKAI
jgi:hypothetical protein